MANGKEHFYTLRELFRMASARRFRATHRTSRNAECLGFGPDGNYMLGWWEGQDEPLEFDPDDRQWSNPVIYV